MIFAATPNIKHYYEEFAKFIGQPNSVGELKSNADELGRLIGTQYDSITSKLMVIRLMILSNAYKYFGLFLQKYAHSAHFEGSLKVVDNKELNADVKIKFKLDDETTNKERYKCNSGAIDSEGFSKDQFECTNTTNDDELWVKVNYVTKYFEKAWQ